MALPSTEPAAEETPERRRLVGFLNFGHALDHLAVLIFPTVVLALSEQFGRPYGELLPLSLGGFIAFGAFSLPAGWMGDRWSRHRMMILFFCGVGLSLIACGLTQTPLQLAVAMTAVGAFAAIYHPVATSMLVRGAARLGRTLGVNGLYGNLGVGFAALLAGALTQFVSWRAAFLVPGAIALVAGIAYALWVSDPDGGRTGVARAKTGGGHVRLDHGLTVRLFAILLGSTIFSGVIFSATTIVMPKVFQEGIAELSTSTGGIGLLVCAVYTLAAFAQLCVGRLIDRYPLRNIFVPIALLQIPLLLLTGASEGWSMVPAAVLMMFVVFGQIPINDTMVGRYTADEFRSRVFAVRYLLSFGAAAAAVPLVAWMHETAGGFPSLFRVLAMLAVGLTLTAIVFPGAARLAQRRDQPKELATAN